MQRFGGNLVGFRNSAEKLCNSWALPLNKRVRVSACKRHMPDTHVFVPTLHKVFLLIYRHQKTWQRFWLVKGGADWWGEFVLGIGLQCVFRRGDVALWGLGNSFSVICVIGLHLEAFLPWNSTLSGKITRQMQRFPLIFAFMVVFAEKACNSFCIFWGKRLLMGGGGSGLG